MEQSTKRRPEFRHLGLVVFLFIAPFASYADSKKAVPIISEKLLTVGVDFEVKFEIERLSFSEPTLVFAREPQGFSVATPPTITYDQEKPETPGKVTVVLKCKTNANGYFSVPVTYFNFPEGDQVTSEQALLPIGLKAHPQFVPPDLEWQVSSGTFYKGQSIHVEIRLLYAKGLLIPQKVQTPLADGLSFTPSTYLSPGQDMQLAGNQFRAIPVLSFNAIALRSGILRLPEIKLEFAEFSRVVPSKTIQVAEVPVDKAKALGSFEFNLVQDKTNWNKDQNIIVKLITRGRGNFSSFAPPPMQSGTLGLVNRETRFSIHESLLGTEGYREDIFTLKANENGSYPITIEGFSIFDPELGHEKLIETLTTVVKVDDAAADVVAKSPSVSGDFFDSFRFGLTLCLISLGFLLICLSFKFKKIRIGGLVFSSMVVIGGLVMLAYFFPFNTVDKNIAGLPNLYDSGKVAQAYHVLLDAMLRYPGDSELNRFAQAVDFPSLGPQIPSLVPWIMNAGFLISLGIFVLLHQPSRKSSIYVLRFLSVSFLISVGLTVLNHINLYNYTGIVGHQGAQVRSITAVTAKPISELVEGSVVSVIDSYKEFSLVETSNHIKGWVLSKDITNNSFGSQ